MDDTLFYLTLFYGLIVIGVLILIAPAVDDDADNEGDE